MRGKKKKLCEWAGKNYRNAIYHANVPYFFKELWPIIF